MLKEIDTNKLDKLIKDKFPIIYEYNFDGIVLLYGGSIRDTMMNNDIHDLDFVVLSQDKDQVLDFISEYNLSYKKNTFGGYKINYNKFEIDIFTTNDLLDVARYDIDLLFYDILEHVIIPCGLSNVFKKRTITEINNNFLFFNYKILKKSIKFVRYITKSNKIVFVKHNIFNIIYIKLKKDITNMLKGRK